MRRFAVLFVLAVIGPSLALAWLAVRSLKDQQMVFERQQQLLAQGVADQIGGTVVSALGGLQQELARRTEQQLADAAVTDLRWAFDDRIRHEWPMARVGFVVDLAGECYSPSVFGAAEARRFRLENERFLCNRESVEVVWNTPKGRINLSELDAARPQKEAESKSVFATRWGTGPLTSPAQTGDPNGSFRHIVANARQGTVARFVQDELALLLWYRPPALTNLVFGVQLALPALHAALGPVVKVEPDLAPELFAVLRDDSGKPVARSGPGEIGTRRPLAASEIGEMLPHWQVAVFPLHPERAGYVAATTRLTLGLLILVLVLAISAGSWLIVTDLRRQLTLARQRTDFVGNISHELKTPLTSIRMFTELLVRDGTLAGTKQEGYLRIIATETARLTRLINQVLDFARLERGEYRPRLQPCELTALVRTAVDSYRPQLEAAGFRVLLELPATPVTVPADADAIMQAVLNLLSNAEKYSGDGREITVEVRPPDPARASEGQIVAIAVLDRGPGVPAAAAERIFEQFYRAHDSLAGGIPGSGLGLTLARQIARQHGGDLVYAPREGGGSEFQLRLPAAPASQPDPPATPPAAANPVA